MLARHDHQASREIVHPQVERAVDGTGALDHAENLQAVLAPGVDVGRLDAHVPQGTDGTVGHVLGAPVLACAVHRIGVNQIDVDQTMVSPTGIPNSPLPNAT